MHIRVVFHFPEVRVSAVEYTNQLTIDFIGNKKTLVKAMLVDYKRLKWLGS